ncbi:MAG: hypothetical protein N3A58_05900 [Spirochaetes bacterium]|nr:hypothetical protein [Spirochaetota bacterium]
MKVSKKLLIILAFLLFFSPKIFAQWFIFGTDIFIELNGGFQNYTHLTYTAQKPYNSIFILHTGIRFSLFPIVRFNDKIMQRFPLGLTLIVAYNGSNDFGNYDIFKTHLGRDYDIRFLRFTLMIGYCKGGVDYYQGESGSYLMGFNIGVYYSKFLWAKYRSDTSINWPDPNLKGYILDDLGIRIEYYWSASFGIGTRVSFFGLAFSIFVDINLKDLIVASNEKLTYWSLGLYLAYPIHFLF